MNLDLITRESIEEERYELQTGPAYSFAPSRREFVGLVGAGIAVSVAATPIAAQQRGRRGGQRSAPANLSQRLHIGDDGVVTVLTGKVEVGQDARTQVAQAAAEELQISLDRIQVVMGDTDLCPNDGGTSGSRTTPSTIPQVRTAAAAAKEILLDLASAHLDADRSGLTIRPDGNVRSEKGTSVSFGELAKESASAESLNRPIDPNVSVRRVEQWQILGTSPSKVGGEAVVTGAKQHPSDIQLPDMLYGKVLRGPALGATLESVDLEPAQQLDVQIVRDGQFVGCAATSSYMADKGVQALAKAATWQHAEHEATSENLYQYLKEHANTGTGGGGRGGRRGGGGVRGSIDEGMRQATQSFSANFEIAYIQHAPMEPRAAVAEWRDGKLTVWTGTQNPMRVRGELMEAFRLPAEKVRVIVPDTGGGFGGKHTGECALEAAKLAQAVGKPVSLRWTREEEFQWAYFRPAGLIEAAAGLDANNKIVAWDFKNYNSGGSAVATPYDVPNINCQSIRCDAPLRAGSYRALASTANNFARECFMDELAKAANADPLQFRLDHLSAGRLRDVLETAAERFNWAERKANLQAGQGIGLACGTEKASYVATCVSLEVDSSDQSLVLKDVCTAFECGAIQNPVNLLAQVEGCLIMGLGGAMTEEIKFADGVVSNGSFGSYIVPRMSSVPKLDTVLINRPDLESVGAGETPIIGIAPAISNAFFSATGHPLRSLPLRTG